MSGRASRQFQFQLPAHAERFFHLFFKAGENHVEVEQFSFAFAGFAQRDQLLNHRLLLGGTLVDVPEQTRRRARANLQ